jgi:hypothetical protein
MGGLWVKEVPLALACVAILFLSGIGLPTAQAQGDVSSTGVLDSAPVGDAPLRPVIVPRPALVSDELQVPGPPVPRARGPEALPDSGPDALPDSGPEVPPDRIETGLLDLICESIFGPASAEEWRPLDLSTFFTEGWNEPYVNSPPGTNGAPKQTWFGAADATFTRVSSLEFFFTDRMTSNKGLLLSPFTWAPVKPDTNGNQYWASYNLYLPLNQRLELLVVVPFVASNKTSPTGHYVSNFGDLTISERFRLIEERNFTLQALLTERTPIGQTVNGNDISYITPSVEFWWNFAPRWVLRGGTGINIDTGRTSVTDTYFQQRGDRPLPHYQGRADLQAARRPRRRRDHVGRLGPERPHHRGVHRARIPVRPGPEPEVVPARCRPGAGKRAPSLRLAAQFLPGAQLLTAPVGLWTGESKEAVPSSASGLTGSRDTG